MAGPCCAVTCCFWSAINRGTEWVCTECRNHRQGLIQEHTASVLSKDTSDKAPPLHKLFVQPDPSHTCTKVWPGTCLRPWSSWYLTLLSEKQQQHWWDAYTPRPTGKLCKCRNVQQKATKPHHKQSKYLTPCNSYPKRIKHCFRDLGTKHSFYRHVINEPSATISAAIKQIWVVLASQSFLSSSVLSWSIESNLWIQPSANPGPQD